MTDRRAILVLAALSVLALVAASRTRVEGFWGDGATYHAMAHSLAEDFDLRYEARDIFRIRREIPAGPQGLFLKRAFGGWTTDDVHGLPYVRRVRADEGRLYYAKPFLYSLAAAPLVRLLGTSGLFVLNALSLASALFLGYLACRRERSPGRSLTLVLALTLGTVTPLYLGWLAPEIFYFSLAMLALALWRLDRPWASCVLLGTLTFAKPPNIFLALPVLLEPLLVTDAPLHRRIRDAVGRGLLVAATTIAMFGINVAFTGELNFQSGERKTFYEAFPFEMRDGKEVRFGSSGIWMTTPGAGPMAQGDDAPPPTARTEPARPPSELRASFVRNLGYFWVGRFGGAFAYFMPVVIAVALYFLTAMRSRRGALILEGLFLAGLAAVTLIPDRWYGGGLILKLVLLACYILPLVAAAVALSFWGPRRPQAATASCALLSTFVFYIWFIPDNWYGGSGTVGNRYFLTLVPLALFIVPVGLEAIVGASGVIAVAVFLWPIFLAPVWHSAHPDAHATRESFRALPAELTMLNDLSVFGETWRKRKDYGDTGDEHKHWPAEPTAYRLYFSDDGTYGREEHNGVSGFWLRGGESAEVVLRAFDIKSLRRIHVAVTGGPAGDEVTIRAEGHAATLALAAGESKEAVFAAGRGFAYKETFLYVLELRSRKGALDPLGRNLGTFVTLRLEVDGKR